MKHISEWKTYKLLFLLIVITFIFPGLSSAGNKRMMAIKSAKAIAARALVESIYGLKIRSTESVVDMVAANYKGVSESKTKSTIRGIKYESIEYDTKKDVAKVVASVSLDSIENIDGTTMKLNNKVFRRVGYGTTTPANAGPLKALRVAELDGYQQLAQQLVGFMVESETSTENFVLKSDVVKTKLLATLYLAEVTDYGWEKNGDAFINMQIDVANANQVLGQDLGSQDQIISVQGMGAQEDEL